MRCQKHIQNFLLVFLPTLNPELETVIHNRHDLACHLADKWYTDNITKEEVEAEWDKFYDYYDDVDGLFHEDENGYLI